MVFRQAQRKLRAGLLIAMLLTPLLCLGCGSKEASKEETQEPGARARVQAIKEAQKGSANH